MPTEFEIHDVDSGAGEHNDVGSAASIRLAGKVADWNLLFGVKMPAEQCVLAFYILGSRDNGVHHFLRDAHQMQVL